MTNHLFDAFRGFMSNPGATFIETLNGHILTYADMLDLSARFANVLVDEGVKKGDRVAVQVEKSAEALMLYLACVRCGAVYLPLNTGYTVAELEYFFNDAKPALIVVAPENTEKLSALIADR
ncbi:Acetyl-coenzyme A synthetase [Paenochrobactrum sp. BZR 201-1]